MPFSESDIVHDESRSRFYTIVEGQIAHLDYERVDPRTLDFRHTWVPEDLRSRGIGRRLVREALDRARSDGLRVIPSCSFVAAIVRRYPEYQDIVAETL